MSTPDSPRNDAVTATERNLPNAGPYADHQQKPPTPFKRFAMWIVVSIAVGSGALWAGAIIWGAVDTPKPVNWKTDRRFFEEAEPICAAAMDKLETFPKAHESATPADRAAVVRETTAILDQMLTDLREVVPEDSKDAKWINMWIDDWGIHIDDRLAFAEKLEGPNPEDQEFYETPKEAKQISRSLDEFATQNEIYSCETPGDV